MKTIGIDLSMRGTGLSFVDGDKFEYKLIKTDSKILNDEQLLIHIAKEVIVFIKKHDPEKIGLEGLSFGSLSGAKDIIAGNFWYLRTEIFKELNRHVEIIPVLTWRSPLFTKEDRKILKEYSIKMKALKVKIKSLKTLKEKKQLKLDNMEIVLNSDIKYLTWLKLPANIRSVFEEEVGFDKGGADLTDAYFIAKYLEERSD
jgi:hypothetical protein